MDLIHNSLRGTFNWFKSKFGFEAIEQGSTPSTPSTSIRRLYPKSDGWYDLDDAGTETKIGAGGTGSGLPDTFTGTAGEALSQYDVVYANASDSGELWIATNDGTAIQADAIGIVTASGGIADTSTGEVTRLGPITNAGWSWTPGATLWLGVDGAITETMPSAGNYAKPLGYAETATTIWLAPQNGWLVGFDVELSEVPPGHTGRVELVSSTQLEWTGYKYPGWDATKGRDIEIIPSSIPVLNYSDNDLDGNPLVASYPYDLYLETVSATSAAIKAKKWTNATTRAVTPALWHGRERYDNTTDAGKKRLWIGTVYLNTGPVFVDAQGKRFIWNKYNPKPVLLGVMCPYSTTTSESISSGSWVSAVSNGNTYKAEWVNGEESEISMSFAGNWYSASGSTILAAIGVDAKTPYAYSETAQQYNTYGLNVSIPINMRGPVSVGYHYALPIFRNAYNSGGTVYYYDTNAIQLNLVGSIYA